MPAKNDIAAVVLAAGASRRFGAANKLLACIEGRTLIERVVDAVERGGIGDIVVVTGWDRAAVEGALHGRRLRFAHCDRWEDGMGASIGAGIAAVDARASAAFVVPGDMPLLTGQIVAQLIDAFESAGRERIVFPMTKAGEQRNPVLWPRRHFGALLALPSARGGKALLQLIASECLPVAAPDVALSDIDTSAELEAARKLARE